MSSGSGKQQGTREQRGRTTPELVTLLVSMSLIGLLVGALIYYHVRSDNQPAVVEVRPQLEKVRQEKGHYYLPVDVENTGTRTAADVEIEVVLETPAGPERATARVTFLSSNSVEHVQAVFATDPRTGPLKSRATSFLEP